MKPRKIAALEEMARELVGDGKSPNLFFVTDQGVVVTVSRSFDEAYAQWRELTLWDKECALEDRKNGTLASVEPDEETGRLRTHDDTYWITRKGRAA